LLLAGFLVVACFCDARGAADEPKTRTFQFTYSATVTGLPENKQAQIWLPVPPSNSEQHVRILKTSAPAKEKIATEPLYGNRIFFVKGKADAGGKINVAVTYLISRRELKAEATKKEDGSGSLDRFLQPDAKVPVTGKPLELIKDTQLPKDQLASARMLYDIVNAHMRYSKEGTGWGQGDSVWACESGYGNCSDFHSLFISLARSRQIPAKFEIGFPLPPKRGEGEIPGYHCWAKFHPAGRDWIPVDISEANKNPRLKDYYFGNLTEDRVTFSTGRDIDLVPRQAGQPLNYFIYPYVEVDKKPYDKVEKKFTFKDLPGRVEK
jgi:transglutaminase-like putative cysteine protease